MSPAPDPAPGPPPLPGFRTLQPGRVGYRAGLALQEELLEQRRSSDEDILVLLEHDPVITLGRGARPGNLHHSPARLASRGIEVVITGRGGDVTWHGPGQLVGYPIIDLTRRGRDLHRYLRLLEEVLVQTLGAFGVPGRRIAGRTGVWVKDEKIASIGVGVRRWVSWHGFALNVGPDLSGFAAIVPCGLHGVQMTSLERQVTGELPLEQVAAEVIAAFSRVFQAPHAGDYVLCPTP